MSDNAETPDSFKEYILKDIEATDSCVQEDAAPYQKHVKKQPLRFSFRQPSGEQCMKEEIIAGKETEKFEEGQNSLLKERLKDLRHYRDLRQHISSKVFKFLVVWSLCLFALIVANALWDAFTIPEPVLVTLCGGTTVSTIGLVGFIVKGLFGSNGK